MATNLSVQPQILSSVAAELDTLAGMYLAILNLSEQAIDRASLINLGQQALGLQISHAQFLATALDQQRLLIEAKEMLQKIAQNYQLQERANTEAISATIL